MELYILNYFKTFMFKKRKKEKYDVLFKKI